MIKKTRRRKTKKVVEVTPPPPAAIMTCSGGGFKVHPPIAYTTPSCPACELDNKVAELERRVEELEDLLEGEKEEVRYLQDKYQGHG